jgi:hypothetical protein
MSCAETVKVDEDLVDKVKMAVDAALAYEKVTKGVRKLGITGEVGELPTINFKHGFCFLLLGDGNVFGQKCYR